MLAVLNPAWAWRTTHDTYRRGWAQLYSEHVTQADTGCDLDFLVG